MADPNEFEHSKAQLSGSLNTLAETMRNCATIADHFAQVVKNTPFSAEAALQVIHGLAKNTPLAATAATGKRKVKAMEEDSAEDAKKKTRVKKTKKVRDPDMPKRPASSYLLFQNAIRKELKSRNPKLTQPELLAMISKQWAEMTDEQKVVYTSATATAKEKYEQEKAAYDAKAPAAAPVVIAPAPTSPPANKKTTKAPKSAAVVPASDTDDSEPASDEPSSSSEEEDEDEEEEEVKVQPPAKKPKHTPQPPTPKPRKHNKA